MVWESTVDTSYLAGAYTISTQPYLPFIAAFRRYRRTSRHFRSLLYATDWWPERPYERPASHPDFEAFRERLADGDEQARDARG